MFYNTLIINFHIYTIIYITRKYIMNQTNIHNNHINNNNNSTLFQATAHNTHIQIQHGRIYTIEYVHISVIDNMHSYTIDEL